MNFQALIRGDVDYDDRAKRLLDMIEAEVVKHEQLRGNLHKYLITKMIEWVKNEYPKESAVWVEAIKKRCERRYPNLL